MYRHSWVPHGGAVGAHAPSQGHVTGTGSGWHRHLGGPVSSLLIWSLPASVGHFRSYRPGTIWFRGWGVGNTWYFSCLPTQSYRVTSLHHAELVHPIFRCSASATGSRPRRKSRRDGSAPAHARAESNGGFRFFGRRLSFALQVRNHLVPGVARWHTSVFIRFHRSN